jgi:hypothetical protein
MAWVLLRVCSVAGLEVAEHDGWGSSAELRGAYWRRLNCLLKARCLDHDYEQKKAKSQQEFLWQVLDLF